MKMLYILLPAMITFSLFSLPALAQTQSHPLSQVSGPMDVNLNMTGMNITNVSYIFFGNNSVDTYLYRSASSVLTLNSHLIASGGWVNSTYLNASTSVNTTILCLAGICKSTWPSGAVVGGSGTSTQVAFWSASDTLSSDSNLYWDNSGKRLGLGTASPTERLTLFGNINMSGSNVTGINYLKFGNGTDDVLLYRSATDILRTDDSFIVSGTWVNATNLNASSDINGTRLFQGTNQVIDTLSATTDETTVSKSGGTVTIGIADPLIVSKGGTGAASLTDGGILLGSGTAAVTVTAQPTNGQLLIGSTGADPVLATLTGTTNQITVSNGAGSITLSTPQDIGTGSTPTFANLIATTWVNASDMNVTNILRARDAQVVTWINGSSLNITGANNVSIDSPTFFVDVTNDRVGIGTIAPSTKLDVIGGINASSINITGSGTLLNVSNRTHSQLYVNDTGIGYVIIPQGRIGLGTAAPDTALHMKGNRPYITIDHNAADGFSGGLKWLNSAGSTEIELFYDNNADKLYFYDTIGTAFRVTMTRSGNVGIGTIAPQQKLEVVGGINATTWVNASNMNASSSVYGSQMISYGWVNATNINVSNSLYGPNFVAASGWGNFSNLNVTNNAYTTNLQSYSWVNATNLNASNTVYGDTGIYRTLTLGWANLSSYPSACSSSQTLTTMGDTITCSAIAITESQITDLKSYLLNNTAINATWLNVTNDANSSRVFSNNAVFSSWINASSLNISGTNNVSINSPTFFIDTTNSRVGIGTTTPNQKLEVVGGINATTWVNASNVNASNTVYGSQMISYGWVNATNINITNSLYGPNFVAASGWGNFSNLNVTNNAYVTNLQSYNWINASKMNITNDIYATNGTFYGSVYQNIYSSDDGLVLYLPFSEGTGSIAYDRSPYGNDGTLTNGPAWFTNSSCKIPNCLSFDGSNDYVNAGTGTSLDTSNITVLAWVKPSDATNEVIASKLGFGDGRRVFAVKINPKLDMTVSYTGNGTQQDDYSSNSDVPLNEWSFVAVTLDGVNIKHYINGQLDKTTAYAYVLFSAPAEKLIIGAADDGGAYYFNGTIDEVRIYNRSLSADEIRTHYLRGSGFGASGAITADRFRIVNTSANKIFEVNRSALQYDGSKFYIDSSGNVGIGTTNPQQKLEVVGGINATTWVNASNVNASSTTYSSQMISYGWVNATNLNASNTVYSTHFATTNGWGNFSILNVSSGLTVLSSGRVGIMTTTPLYTLDVVGSINATGNITVDGSPVVTIKNATAGSNGLAGYWTFDESAGSKSYDSSGYNNIFTLTSMNTSGNETSGWNSTDCKFGSCLRFDGINDRLLLPSVRPNFNPNNGTFGMWIKLPYAGSENPGSQIFFQSQNSSDQAGTRFALGRGNFNGACATCIFFDTHDGQNKTSYDITSWGANSWHHVAFVWNSTNMSIYTDGVFRKASIYTSISYFGQTNEMGSNINSAWLNGTIDEVKIYSRALSPDELRAEFLAGSSKYEVTLSAKNLIAGNWLNGTQLNVSSNAYIQGNVGIGTTPNALLHLAGGSLNITSANTVLQLAVNTSEIVCDASGNGMIAYLNADGVKKHYGCNETSWNAFW